MISLLLLINFTESITMAEQMDVSSDSSNTDVYEMAPEEPSSPGADSDTSVQIIETHRTTPLTTVIEPVIEEYQPQSPIIFDSETDQESDPEVIHQTNQQVNQEMDQVLIPGLNQNTQFAIMHAEVQDELRQDLASDDPMRVARAMQEREDIQAHLRGVQMDFSNRFRRGFAADLVRVITPSRRVLAEMRRDGIDEMNERDLRARFDCYSCLEFPAAPIKICIKCNHCYCNSCSIDESARGLRCTASGNEDRQSHHVFRDLSYSLQDKRRLSAYFRLECEYGCRARTNRSNRLLLEDSFEQGQRHNTTDECPFRYCDKCQLFMNENPIQHRNRESNGERQCNTNARLFMYYVAAILKIKGLLNPSRSATSAQLSASQRRNASLSEQLRTMRNRISELTVRNNEMSAELNDLREARGDPFAPMHTKITVVTNPTDDNPKKPASVNKVIRLHNTEFGTRELSGINEKTLWKDLYNAAIGKYPQLVGNHQLVDVRMRVRGSDEEGLVQNSLLNVHTLNVVPTDRIERRTAYTIDITDAQKKYTPSVLASRYWQVTSVTTTTVSTATSTLTLTASNSSAVPTSTWTPSAAITSAVPSLTPGQANRVRNPERPNRRLTSDRPASSTQGRVDRVRNPSRPSPQVLPDWPEPVP